MKKKLLAMLLACTMLFAATACGDDSSAKTADTSVKASDSAKPEESKAAADSAAEASQAAAESDSKADEESSKADEASKAEENSKAEKPDSKAADDTSKSDSKSDANKNAGPLLSALIERMKDWKGQIHMNMSAENEGMKIVMDMIMAGKKYYFTMNMADVFKMTGIGDGTTNYMLDDEAKTYAKGVDKDELGMMETPDSMVDDMKDGKLVSSGKGKFKGKEYDYEEYKSTKEGVDAPPDNSFYYFDSNGDLIGISTKDQQGEKQEIAFTIKLEEKIEESRFQMPSGYTEKDSKAFMEEFATKMLTAIFSMIPDESTPAGQ